MTTPRRTLTITAVAIATLVGCTPAAPAEDPAGKMTLGYITSVDQGTPDQCDLYWDYRNDPAAVSRCKQDAPRSPGKFVRTASVVRVIDWPSAPAKGKAVVVKLELTNNPAPPMVVYGTAQDPTTQRWMVVKSNAELKGDPNRDADVLASLG